MTELKCPFCDKIHTDLDTYTDCVCACRTEQRRKEEAKRQKTLQEQQQGRETDVIKAFGNAVELQRKLLQDYPDTNFWYEVLRHKRIEPNWLWSL